MACDHVPEPSATEEQHAARLAYGAKLKSLQFAGASERAIDVRRRDRQFENVDGPAYQRLRKDGIQPINIDGADRLEKCMTHPIEAEIGGNLFPAEKKALVRAGVESVKALPI